MSMARGWKVVLIGIGAVIGLFLVVSAGGTLIGMTRPDRVSYDYSTHFSRPPSEVWARLGLPDQYVQVRQHADGQRYEAAPGDTSGLLVRIVMPDTLLLDAMMYANASVETIETFTPDAGGTRVRLQVRAWLGGGWHRLTFPTALKKIATDQIRDQARRVGDPEPEIEEIVIPVHR